MKLTSLIIVAIVSIGLLASSCKTCSLISEYDQSGQRKDISGKWVGFAQGDLYLYQLNLTSTQSWGKCYSQVSQKATAFKITAWEIGTANQVTIHFAQDSGYDTIKGYMATGTMLSGHITGITGWSNSVDFYHETTFEARIQLLNSLPAPE